MKQFLMTLLLLMSVVMAGAQNAKNKDLNERLFDAKVREIVYRLHITDEQKVKFVPVYRRYSQEMQSIWNQNGKPSKPSNSKEAASLAKRKMERQQRAQAIRIKYIDLFAEILNADQIDHFFEVESNIQKKLMNRIMSARGVKPKQ